MKTNPIKNFLAKTKEYPLGCRWLRFNAFCRLPLMGILYIAVTLTQFAKQGTLQAAELCCGVLRICTFFSTLFMLPISYLLSLAVAASVVIYGAVYPNGWIVVFGLFEIYYFVRRKRLFVPQRAETEKEGPDISPGRLK